MTVAKHKPSTDDKVEAKRRIIRRSLDEITTEVQNELLCANMQSSISLVVPSRYSIVTIESLNDVSSEAWACMSGIVREIVARKLGKAELRARSLVRGVAIAMVDTIDTPPD